MISASGNIARIERDGGTDIEQDGIAALAAAIAAVDPYPSLALFASASKVSVLYAHYAWRYPERFRERVVADGGTSASASHAGKVLSAIRVAGLLDSTSLVCTCESGKEAVLYAVDTTGATVGTLSTATATAADGVSDYAVTDIPELVAARITPQTQVDLDVSNIGPQTVKIYRATGILANFAALTPTAEFTDATLPHSDTGLDATLDYKYKASFIVTGTRNGSPRTVEGPKCAARYAIADNSTVG